MPKASPDVVLDAALNEIADSDTIYVCSDAPANYAGIAAVTLASGAVTPGAGNGDFAVANGTTSGRKVTVGAQTGIEVSATGDADHVVLADASGSVLKYVTTCASQTLTDGNTVNLGAWSVEFADPS
jgi:hypothetical protein